MDVRPPEPVQDPEDTKDTKDTKDSQEGAITSWTFLRPQKRQRQNAVAGLYQRGAGSVPLLWMPRPHEFTSGRRPQRSPSAFSFAESILLAGKLILSFHFTQFTINNNFF